ncbi:hypothetical protein D918_02715, partial [Trichuris suis]
LFQKTSAVSSRDGILSDDEEESKLAAIAKRLEEKYGRSRAYRNHLQESCDLGDGYDTDDSFIDNAEAVGCGKAVRLFGTLKTYALQYDELVPPTVTTEHGGFYINWGKLKFKNTGNEDNPADSERSVSRRGRQHGMLPISNSCKAAAKLKKKCLNNPKPRAFKKALSSSTLKNREKNIEAVVDAVVGCQLPCNGTPTKSSDSMENAINATISQVIREEIQATTDTNENMIASNDAGSSKISSGVSSQKSNSASPSAYSMIGRPPTLGHVRAQRSYAVPEALLSMCDELAKMVGSENSCLRKWSPDALSQLIKIQKACQEKGLNKFYRGAVFRHVQSRTGVPRVELCAFVKRYQHQIEMLEGICVSPAPKNSAAMPLDIFLNGHDPLRQAVDLLRQEIAATMPSLESSYAIDCAKTIRRKQQMIDMYSPNGKQKSVYMPRRRFTWKNSSRSCLHAVFNELEKCHQSGQFKKSVDLKTLMDNFLQTLSVELWPSSWMSFRELRKEYSTFNYEQNNVQRRPSSARAVAPTSSRTKVFITDTRKRCSTPTTSSEPQRTAHATPVITLVPQRGPHGELAGYSNANRNSTQVSGAAGTQERDLTKACLISPSKATPVSISVPTKLSISGGMSPTIHHTVLVSPIKSTALSPNRGTSSPRVVMSPDSSRNVQQAAFVKMGAAMSSTAGTASPPKLMRFSIPQPTDAGSPGSAGLLSKANQQLRMATNPSNPFYQSVQSHWFAEKDRGDPSSIGSTMPPNVSTWSGGQIRQMIVNAPQHLPFLHNVSQATVMANSLEQHQQRQQVKQEQLMHELNEMIVRMEGRGSSG